MDDFEVLISVLKTTEKYFELEKQYCKSIPDKTNLKDFLEQKDEVSIFLSIYYIQELKKNNLSEFLLYMLCLRNILEGFGEISNSFLSSENLKIVNIPQSFDNEIRFVSKILKDAIFTIEVSASSKEELILYAVRVTQFARFLIPNSNEILNLLNSYKTVLSLLQVICSCIDTNHSNIQQTDWQLTIMDSLILIKAKKKNNYLLFFECSCNYIIRYMELINLPALFKEKVITIINDHRDKVAYPMAAVVAIEMDKLIPDYFEGHRMSLVLAGSGSIIANDILVRHSQWFLNAENDYKNTHIGTFPSIDTTILVFFKYLLENHSNFLSLYLANHFTSATNLSHFDLFSSKINLISKFLPEIQDILLEILIAVKLDNNKVMNYFFKTMRIDLKFTKISDEWSHNFQEKACKQPFKEVLLEFKRSELDLEQLLNKATPNIYLIELPSTIQGLTTNSQRILLKFFVNSPYSEVLTFIAYLHELADYLVRTDPNITTFGDANSLNCDKVIANDAGLQLEVNLFGKKTQITSVDIDSFLTTNT